jgi:hypothetical protein
MRYFAEIETQHTDGSTTFDRMRCDDQEQAIDTVVALIWIMFGKAVDNINVWKFGNEYRFNNMFDEPVWIRSTAFGEQAQVREGVFTVDIGDA